MATRAELRTALRLALEDTSGSPLWSDGDLNEALVEAVRSYGVTFPIETSTTFNIVIGQVSYQVLGSVPDGRGIVAVLDGSGRVVPRVPHAERHPGPADASGYEQAWLAWGDTLYLQVAPTEVETWTVRYLGSRSLVADDVTAQPIRAGHEPIVLAIASAWLWSRRAAEDAKRGASSADASRREREASGEAGRLMRQARRRVIGGSLG